MICILAGREEKLWPHAQPSPLLAQSPPHPPWVAWVQVRWVGGLQSHALPWRLPCQAQDNPALPCPALPCPHDWLPRPISRPGPPRAPTVSRGGDIRLQHHAAMPSSPRALLCLAG